MKTTATIAKFVAIVHACEDLRDECDSWTEAAERACDAHGFALTAHHAAHHAALDVVIDCASDGLNMTDADAQFWGGEFIDSLPTV